MKKKPTPPTTESKTIYVDSNDMNQDLAEKLTVKIINSLPADLDKVFEVTSALTTALLYYIDFINHQVTEDCENQLERFVVIRLACLSLSPAFNVDFSPYFCYFEDKEDTSPAESITPGDAIVN